MKLFKYILTITATVFSLSGNAQDIGLNIGDRLPDFTISKIINSANKSVKTSDFNDRLLIIDFWGTTCPGCVSELAPLEALQKQFKFTIKILPVTDESEPLVSAFWKNNKHTKGLSLPSVVEDKLFDDYFKHKIICHEVWVNKGKVIGITGSDYVTADNIKKVLKGAAIDWPVKNDFYDYDQSKPLFETDNSQIEKGTTIKYAAISDYKEKVRYGTFSGGSGIIRNKQQKTIRAYFLNQPIYNTYMLTSLNIGLGKLNKPGASDFPPNPNEVLWEVGDKSKYIYDKRYDYGEDWIRKNGICYESVNPDTGQTDEQVNKQIIADLDGLLGLHVRWEKRKEKVLLLVRTTQEDHMKSHKAISGEYDDKINQKGSLYEFRDVQIPIAYNMNQQATNPYVFDETGYKGNVDMDLNIPSWTDVAAIRKAIAPYGLALNDEERLVDKFVFTEVNGGLVPDVKPKPKTKVADIPFESDKGRILLKVYAGMPDSLQFLFDTGSAGSLIDSLSAANAGIKKDGGSKVEVAGSGGAQGYDAASHQNLRLEGNVPINDVNLVLMNLDDFNATAKAKIKGIIGFDLLNKYTTQVDFDNHTLNLYSDITAVDTSGYTGIPFEFSKGLNIPRFPISVKLDNGETFTGKVMFDCGAELNLLVSAPFKNFHEFDKKIGKTTASKGRGINAMTYDENALIKGMSFNGFDFGPMAIELTVNDKAEPKDGYLGILGMDVIKRFNVILDYANKKIYLKPNKNFPLPFDTKI